jgi:predicted protein tyrosine phosphatase
MAHIHVCSLTKVEATVEEIGAGALVTLLKHDYRMPRPASIREDRHHRVAISDITEAQEGYVLPGEHHVAAYLEFLRGWDRADPMLIHCYAGVSRSTAAAFIAVCALDPERDEMALAQEIRALSPTATPNLLLVKHADTLLGREQRMVRAIQSIGRGADCFEGVPFSLEI